MNKLRVLIADDHPVMRVGLKALLSAAPDIDVVGEASDGEEALRAITDLRPDVVVMDLSMKPMDGLTALRALGRRGDAPPVLALTMHEDEEYFFEMLSAGASGYVPKRAAPDDLLSAIRVVNQDEVFIYPSMARLLVKDFLRRAEETTPPDATLLTPREHEVLAWIADGLTNREIAEQLVISVKTVDRHRENIMRKLNLHNRVELVRYAIEKGLIPVDSGQ